MDGEMKRRGFGMNNGVNVAICESAMNWLDCLNVTRGASSHPRDQHEESRESEAALGEVCSDSYR